MPTDPVQVARPADRAEADEEGVTSDDVRTHFWFAARYG